MVQLEKNDDKLLYIYAICCGEVWLRGGELAVGCLFRILENGSVDQMMDGCKSEAGNLHEGSDEPGSLKRGQFWFFTPSEEVGKSSPSIFLRKLREPR